MWYMAFCNILCGVVINNIFLLFFILHTKKGFNSYLLEIRYIIAIFITPVPENAIETRAISRTDHNISISNHIICPYMQNLHIFRPESILYIKKNEVFRGPGSLIAVCCVRIHPFFWLPITLFPTESYPKATALAAAASSKWL